MRNYSLPTRKECLAIIEEHYVPEHIAGHSRTVAKLAVFLAQRLKEKGASVDVDLVDRACLLHDIARVCDLEDCAGFEQNMSEQDKTEFQELRAKYKEIPHEYAAYDILKDKYPALALTIRKHRYMAIVDEEDRPVTWEEKLVYYADKRVMHDRIVPLKERLDEAHRRYARLYNNETQRRITIAKVDPLIYNLEKEIFDRINLNPLDVTNEFVDSYPKQS